MYVSQFEMLISVEDSEWLGVAFSSARSKLVFGSPRGASAYLHQKLTPRLLNLTDDGSFILASMVNISYQVDLRSLCGPFFVFKILFNMKWYNGFLACI